MNHLLRDVAPVTSTAWAEIDAEARRAVKEVLAGRRLLDVGGPHGWELSAVPSGRSRPAAPPAPGIAGRVRARVREPQPIVELRTDFSLDREELERLDRGACDADLDPVRLAARDAAVAEDRVVFHGFPDVGLVGVAEESPHEPVTIDEEYDRYPSFVALAMSRLRLAGVGGPYAIALGPRCYTGVVEQSEMGGYPVLEHLRLILGGPVVFAPGVDGAVVMSLRGGDAEVVLGQDLSIGYSHHDEQSVHLYLVESFTVKVCAPEAFVALRYVS